jgi:DNA-binding TFAR19-related protein (PDSD5 family)
MSFQLPSGLKPAQPPAQGQQGGGGGDNGESAEKMRQQEEMKRGMIASMLSTDARERRKSLYTGGEEADDSIEDSIN